MNRVLRGSGAILLGALLCCNARVGETIIGGETHFLVTCGEGCGPSLSCIEGVCTRSCEPGFSSCSELATAAACVTASDTSGVRTPFSGTCDVSCDIDSDCAGLGAGYGCRSGACRAQPEAREAAFAAAISRGPALVSAVDTATCQSGLLWQGGEHGSAEMLPGSDCVGCHRDSGARPLMLGGTVYPDGGYLNQPLDDCFGLEGVEVVVTDADGRERSTLTNRAGNFYVEGDASEFVTPYTATIRWRKGTEEFKTPMVTVPSYGGCARCHSASAVPFVSSGFSEEEAAAQVIPSDGVLYTPGLYEKR